MIKENLLDLVGIPKENIHPIKVEKTSIYSARKYESDMREFFEVEEDKIPIFDLMLLGMGEDGHTASLFPGSEAAKDTLHLVSSVSLTGVERERVTITIPLINNAREVIFLITGQTKAETVTRVLAEKDVKISASLVSPQNGKAIYFLDKEAGSLLKTEFME